MKGQSGSHYNFDIKSTWNIITIPNAGTNWPSMIVHQNQCLMRQGDCHWPKHGNLMCWNAIILDYIASHDIVEEEQLLLTHVEFCLHQLCHDRKICLNYSSPRLSACCCCPAPALQCFCYTELRIRDHHAKRIIQWMGPDLASILMKELLIKIFLEEQKVPHYQLTCHLLGPASA